jgi:hypothetical protein
MRSQLVSHASARQLRASPGPGLKTATVVLEDRRGGGTGSTANVMRQPIPPNSSGSDGTSASNGGSANSKPFYTALQLDGGQSHFSHLSSVHCPLEVCSVADSDAGARSAYAGEPGPCLPPLRLIFPALFRPGLALPLPPPPPHPPSPKGDSFSAGGLGDPTISAWPDLLREQHFMLPKKRLAAAVAGEEGGCRRAWSKRPASTLRQQPLLPHISSLKAAAEQINHVFEASAEPGGRGGHAGDGFGSDSLRCALSTAADACQGWAVVGGHGGPGCCAGPGGPVAAVTTPVRCSSARGPPLHAAAGATDGVTRSCVGGAGAPLSAFRVIPSRRAGRFGPQL